MLKQARGAVKFIRWPAQRDIRNECRKEGLPCLLVVEAGARPPMCNDPLEDWVRAPISSDDLRTRVDVLVNRANKNCAPVLDSTGTLWFGKRSTAVSNVQAELLGLFIEEFREVVYREELEERLSRCVPRPTRNSLDLHVMRLRRRLAAVDLAIRTAWGRGYALEPQAD